MSPVFTFFYLPEQQQPLPPPRRPEDQMPGLHKIKLNRDSREKVLRKSLPLLTFCEGVMQRELCVRLDCVAPFKFIAQKLPKPFTE